GIARPVDDRPRVRREHEGADEVEKERALHHHARRYTIRAPTGVTRGSARLESRIMRPKARFTRGGDASVRCGGILARTLLALLLASACEPVRSRPLQPAGAAGLVPTRPDPDAGQVGIRADFDLEAYRAIEVGRF